MTEPTTQTPVLTPSQQKIFETVGNYRISRIVPVSKTRTKLIDVGFHDKFDGISLNAAITQAVVWKAELGNDYMVSDARTTKMLWNTQNISQQRCREGLKNVQ